MQQIFATLVSFVAVAKTRAERRRVPPRSSTACWSV